MEGHRELMVTATSESGRIRQFGFMRLPEALQDEVVELLDRRMISFREASRLLAERGYPLNREAVRRYYKILSEERRMFEMRCSMASTVRAFQDVPVNQSLQALLHLLSSAVSRSLTDSQLRLRDSDIPRLMEALIKATSETTSKSEATVSEREELDREARGRAIRELYGL